MNFELKLLSLRYTFDLFMPKVLYYFILLYVHSHVHYVHVYINNEIN